MNRNGKASWYANQLRHELGVRNRRHARGCAHVQSYGNPPVVVYAPENERHGNFFDPAYAVITRRPDWMRRFNKVHAQAARSLPKAESGRRWRELDSSMSSDALLMNVFCTPGVVESAPLQNMLGVEADAVPVFGWRARVPLTSGLFDRTEVDLRLGGLLVEAKLTESDFQTCAPKLVESYRDFDAVFERERLPRVELPPVGRREPSESPEDYSQEFESILDPAAIGAAQITRWGQAAIKSQLAEPSTAARAGVAHSQQAGYAGYQLIRNVLAAYASGCSFCVLHDERRPDLREEWYSIMAAVRSAEMRTRCKVLTWQELCALLPDELQEFLDRKYGIAAPGRLASPAEECS